MDTKNKTNTKVKSKSKSKSNLKSFDKIVYFLQGGGALGSYQVGVCQGLIENNYSPDWVIGTSIGAINAAIIAGSEPKNRIENLQKFWSKMISPFSVFLEKTDNKMTRYLQNIWLSYCIMLFGLPGFFKPRILNPWFLTNSSPEMISFYKTDELRETLSSIIDFSIINDKKMRITLGAVCVEDGRTHNFDNMQQEINLDHVMASCALPPGFPAIRIKDKTYWDGGLSSNTPVNIILKEELPSKSLCFIINLFQNKEEDPKTMLGVLKRFKDIIYSSRHHEVLKFFKERHKLELAILKMKKEEEKNHPNEALLGAVKNVHPQALNIIRFHYQDKPYELLTKDFIFSKNALKDHFEAGYQDVQKAMKNPKWFEPIEDYSIIFNEVL